METMTAPPVTAESDPQLVFQDVAVTRGQLVNAARQYLGMPYSMTNTYVSWIDGKPVGKTNCLFLLLLVAEDVGLLPKGWIQERRWIRIHQKRAGQGHGILHTPTRHTLSRSLLSINCDEIPKEHLLPGDIIVESWSDIPDRPLAEEHLHACIYTSLAPPPFGSKIHAIGYQGDPNGKVEEVVLNALDWQKRIVSVHRIRGITD